MMIEISYEWRGQITDAEMVRLVESYHGIAEEGWWDRIRPHSLGWVVGRIRDGSLACFANVAWDGSDHAFLIDTKVRADLQRFRDYVEHVWWPSRHLEVSTKAGYRANLNKHFLPYFGSMPMAEILPSTVQGWVTKAVADGLSARSVVKYHVMLHGIFKRAVRDRVIAHNPTDETELPNVVAHKTHPDA